VTDYGSYYTSQTKRRGFWAILRDIILVLVTLLSAVALVVTYFSPFTDPNNYWQPAFFGLAAPIIFIINILLLLTWTIRWKFWSFFPLVALIPGLWFSGSMLQLQLRTDYPDPVPAKDKLTVMTYNTHGFFQKLPNGDFAQTVDSISAFIHRVNPDVICFQEYESMRNSDSKKIDELLTDWRYRTTFLSVGDDWYGWGIAIFSKHPMFDAHSISFENSNNAAQFADILFRGDTLRIFNNHLQSNHITEERRLQMENMDIDNGSDGLIREVGSSLRTNFRKRAVQADSISEMIGSSPYPVIVVGDFNDTPLSYAYRTMLGKLNDTFKEKGSGYGYTFNNLFRLLRIDYIFTSPQLTTVQYSSERLPWSDHNPVWVRLKMPEKKD